MKLEAAEQMADRMNGRAPAGVRYEVGHSGEGELLAEEPEFGGYFVRRVVDRSAVPAGTLRQQATPDR